MKFAYQIIKQAVITEKGLSIKESQNTLVLQVAPKSYQDRNKGSRAGASSRLRGASRAHGELSRQRAASRKFAGIVQIGRSVRAVEDRREKPEYALNLVVERRGLPRLRAA